MQLLITSDTTSLSYWLTWRVLLCAIWVLGSMCIALYLIWKYEDPFRFENDKGKKQQEEPWIPREDETWRPCIQGVHPIWLMVFRIVAFSLLLSALVADVAAHGAALFHYYTQWTFTLATMYFMFASLLSIYGCYWHQRICGNACNLMGVDAEQGLYTPLDLGGSMNGIKKANFSDHKGEGYIPSRLCNHSFQILFQMTAGAVMLTDGVYWSIIFPFLTIRDYELSFLTVVAHSLNAILLVGDTALNSLRFPWFRISYFVLLTGAYVVFQWAVHACVSMWWPYPFLDLSSSYAPLWYLIVALMHIPCYWAFALLVKIRDRLCSI